MPNSFRVYSSALIFCLGVSSAVRSPVDVDDADMPQESPGQKSQYPFPKAKFESENEEEYVFSVNATAFVNLDPLEEWVVYASSDCRGEELAHYQVARWISQMNPSNESNATLSLARANLPDHDVLFAGARGLGHCLAYLHRPPQRWPVMQWLKELPGFFQGRMYAFLAVREEVAHRFQVAFLLVLLLFGFILFWSLRLVVKAVKDRRRHWGLSVESSESQLRPPQTSEIVLRAFTNIVFFLLGCAIFVVEGQRFFRKYDDASEMGYILFLTFPVLFGCAGVLRIFMAAARSHLYFSSLRHGLLLQLRRVNFSGDWMLLWMWFGIVLTMGRAVQVVYFNKKNEGLSFEDFKAIGLLASPIFYIKKSISDMWSLEDIAVRQECRIGLEGISGSNSVQIGDERGINPIEESAFVALARHREEIHATTASQGDEGSTLRSLNVGDVRWIGFVTREKKKSRLNRLLPMLLGPSLVGALLGLAILSLTVVFLNMTTAPALQDLRIDGALLYPAFKSTAKEYFAYLDVSQRVFGFTAAVDSYKTTKVQVQSVGKQRLNSTASVIVDSLNLDETPYPQKVQIKVEDTACSTDYSVQVSKFGIFPESLTVSGQTDSGKHFSLCIPWGYIFFNTTIHLPTGLKELKLSLTYQLYVMGLPWTNRSNDSFSTYFDRQIPRRKCRYGRHPLWEQAAFYAYSGSGCFAGMQRNWMSCGKARTAQTKKGLQILSGNVSGSFCPLSSVRSANIFNASGECYPLQVSDGSLELTSTSLLPEKDKEDLQAKFNMFLHLPSGMIEILGMRNAFEPKSDLLFTLRKRNMTHTFQEAMVLAPGVEVHEKKPDHLTFEVVDGSALVNTSVLQIIVFSEDLDCHITHLLHEDSKLESISTPQGSCEGNPMGEVCKDGWKPTSSFVLPMSLFREVLVEEHHYSEWKPLDLHARGTCRSLEDFMNDSFTNDTNGLKVSLSLKQPPEQVLWVPMIAGQELGATKEEHVFEALQQSDRLDVSGSWHKDPSSMQLVVVWRQNCSLKEFKPEDDAGGVGFSTSQVVRSYQEVSTSDLCAAASLNVTKACGGTLQSSSIEVSLESDHNLEKLKFEATLSCSDRLKSQKVLLELVVGNHSSPWQQSNSDVFEDDFWRSVGH